jgi:hypothetical protein
VGKRGGGLAAKKREKGGDHEGVVGERNDDSDVS